MTTTQDSKSGDFSVDDVMAQSRKLAERMGIKSPSWFGMDLDTDTRNNLINPLWLTANSYAQDRWRGNVEGIIGKGLDVLKTKGIGAEGSKLLKAPIIGRALKSPRLAATVFFGLVSASPMLPALAAPFTKWRKDRADMAKTCAPVLQDMASEGLPHSIGGIGMQDNEVIYAHRTRLNKTLSHTSGNNVLSLASSQVPTLLGATSQKKGTTKPTTDHHHASSGGLLHMLPGAVDLLMNKYTAARNKEMVSQQSSCSAYELIANLDEQIKKQGGKGDILKISISLPKAMGKNSCTLSDYIATIIKTHSADMERMLPDEYSQLRDALKPQLNDVSKALAESIAAGDLSILSLIRLVGEGKIIKQQGRGLVEVEELKSQIGKHAGTQAAKAEVDPKEYLKMATFKEKELKETLAKLEGTERSIFASMFPDVILKKAGMSAAEIKTMREETAPMYEKNLANLLVGIAAQPDDALKAQGLASTEITEIKKAAKTIEEKGADAVHTMRANAVKPIGIELTAINAAMGKINEPHYFGKMLAAGNELLATSAANDDTYVNDKDMPKTGKVPHHGEAANDADYGEGEGHQRRPRHSHETAEHGKHTRQHQERARSSDSAEHGHHSHRA